MKNNYIIFVCFMTLSLFLPIKEALAMPIGTILYRTSGANKMYGYNENNLIVAEKGKLAHIYSGHAAIYVGREAGVDYIVEMQPKGAIKIPAKYFINESLGEELVGAKIPKNATPNQIAKAVAIAKNLAEKNLAYDFDFKYQKGPLSNQWTCVGLTEKVYESAGISNPSNLGSLVYNPNNYAVDITRDGYDSTSVYNKVGDCFSTDLEYSKIERKTNMIIPAPEFIGFDVGLEKNGERFIFLPYTQYLQDTLEDVTVDIDLSSSFSEPELRGDSPILGLVLKWSLINNPVSAVKNIVAKVSGVISVVKDKAFPDSGLVLADDSTDYDLEASVSTSTKSAQVKASTTKKTTVKVASTSAKTNVNANTGIKVALIKATSTKGVSVSGGSSKTVGISLTTPKNTTTAELSTTKSTVLKVASTKTTTTPLTTTASTSNTTTIVNSPKVATTPVVAVTPVIVTTPKTTTVVRTTPKPIIPIATSTPIINNPVTTSTTNIISTTTTETIETEKPVALIAKIYSNDDDDWLEIINASDFDFDLAAAGYRLEKSKTGADPTLIMRVGNELDGTYPGGTVIGAHSYYLIARSTASADILAQADAIATKDTFSWTEEGYTLYLGTASISSDSDTDIVDKLGYGEATYYEEQAAQALKKGYALERKVSATSTIESMMSGGLEELWPRLYDSNDNSADFILVPYDLSVVETETEVQENNDSNVSLRGLNSENMTHLWHFDECYGTLAANELQASGQEPVDIKKSDKWLVGRWGCATALGKNLDNKAVWNNPLDPNQMTTNFYFRGSGSNFSLVLKFSNPNASSGQAYLEFTPYFSNMYGFPGPEGRFENLTWPSDNLWHQFSLVVDRQGGYWSLYLDGKEVYSYKYSGIIPTFSSFELSSQYEELVAVDELSFWDRSLPASELLSINSLNQLFNPYTWPEAQPEAKLERYWSFDENGGTSAKDSVGTDNFSVSPDMWNMEGKNASALTIGSTINTTLNSLPVSDLSLSFWWRNFNNPNEGRMHLLLKNGDRVLMSLVPTPINSLFSFNGYGEYVYGYGKSLFPYDANWHHLVLTYDSYNFLLKFYIDGQEIFTKEYVKFKEGEKINGLEIVQENWPSSIDELKIWSGTLSAAQVLAEYQSLN